MMPMRSMVAALVVGCAVLPTVLVALRVDAALVETWESQATQNPFLGTGDLIWSGDVSAWAITTATWPTSPAQDFAGARSLRSDNHGSLSGAPVVETVFTNISSEVDFSRSIEWSVFFSGNSAIISVEKRADFLLLADTPSAAIIEDPLGLNGYKLTLWDPRADAASNVPPLSHEAAALADSLTLWRVDDTDDRWRVVGSIPLGTEIDDIREGWNLRARRDPDGTWSIGFATGAIGQTPPLTSLGIDPGAPDLSNFIGTAFAGVGWLAPNNTTNDHRDFGFDNFSVTAVPEPSAGAVILSGLAILTLTGLVKRRWPRRNV
jgi:hypothetical protein